MNGDVLNFTKSVHQRTQELLPWFLTGTLDAEERVAVEQHLPGCPACRAELQSLQAFQAAYVSSDMPPDTERALDKLRARLDAEAAVPAMPRQRPGIRLPNLLGHGPAWMKLGLAAQFGVIFALGWEVVQTERTGFEYRTLASASTPARAAGSLVVVFDPNAPQREVARILRRSGARVVDGPTASNGYVLATSHDGLQAALTSLRAEPAVVLAEPLQAPSTP
jgi:anti-sigma factor RsiW